MQLTISSFYRFTPLLTQELEEVRLTLETMAVGLQLRGLFLIGPEGVNATVSGPEASIKTFKSFMTERFGVTSFKDSFAGKHPFSEFKVKIKDEIVTLGQPGVVPTSDINHHLTPAEWHEALKDPNTLVLDTRNDYEVDIGKFKNAIDLNLSEFQEFPERVKALELPKDQKVLMYCTGGIRCEKAILEMKSQGYENVFQLQGGILEYIKEFPEQEFEGECFVFDYRIALDQKLQPTKQYKFCPHCGQPGQEVISCSKCAREETICSGCKEMGGHFLTCSKNCAHHFEIGSTSSKPHLQEIAKRQNI